MNVTFAISVTIVAEVPFVKVIVDVPAALTVLWIVGADP